MVLQEFYFELVFASAQILFILNLNKMKKKYILGALAFSLFAVSCKKDGCTDPIAINYNDEADNDDGFCEYSAGEAAPTDYVFTDADGNNTVSYTGQTERLAQLAEMVVLMKTGTSQPVDVQKLDDMFANVGDNGNGNFSFSSTKQLENKCFAADVDIFKNAFDSVAVASLSNGVTAQNGVAGTLTTTDGASTYLFNSNGIEYLQIAEKGLMGAVFMHQALNVYFGDGKMDVDNTTPEDPANGKYYTEMEHHFDEAFGYFGVDPTFPVVIPSSFWGKYSNSQGMNDLIMNDFIRGRFAITQNNLTERDAAINALRQNWEILSAMQAIDYLNGAVSSFGSDQSRFLHVVAEAYAFVLNLRYAPVETRQLSQAQVNDILAMFGDNFWNLTLSDINAIKSALEATY